MDAEARKLLAQPWAETGDRELPEDLGLDRAAGWPVRYEQPGADAEPERTVFNQLLFELGECWQEYFQSGVSPWDSEIDYPASDAEGYAFVVGSDRGLYVALIPSGPALGNSTDPTSSNNTAWQEY